MKLRPLYQHLDTSFANLAALLRYLRCRHFVGQIRIEIGDYEADIFLTESGEAVAREFDNRTGRTAEGEDALQRILIRAREPNGSINVYQEIKELFSAHQTNQPVRPNRELPAEPYYPSGELLDLSPKTAVKPLPNNGTPLIKPDLTGLPRDTTKNLKLPENFSQDAPEPWLNSLSNFTPSVMESTKPLQSNGGKEMMRPAQNYEPLARQNRNAEPIQTPTRNLEKPKPMHIPRQLSLSEQKRRQAEMVSQKQHSPAETEYQWHELLQISSHLFQTIETVFLRANLDFSAFLLKIQTELADDFSFLEPTQGDFVYEKSLIKLKNPPSPRVFVAGINECLRRMLEKLNANPRLEVLHDAVRENLAVYFQKHRQTFDRLSFTPQLERNLGH